MKLSYTAEEQRAWNAEHLPPVQEKLDEEVLAYGIWGRAHGMTDMLVSKASPLAGTIIRTVAKKKAGGLPHHFILALTPTKLHVLNFRFKRSGFKVGDELAVWERSGLRFSVEQKQVSVRLTIESPSEDEKVLCEATKTTATDDFLAALGAIPATA